MQCDVIGFHPGVLSNIPYVYNPYFKSGSRFKSWHRCDTSQLPNPRLPWDIKQAHRPLSLTVKSINMSVSSLWHPQHRLQMAWEGYYVHWSQLGGCSVYLFWAINTAIRGRTVITTMYFFPVRHDPIRSNRISRDECTLCIVTTHQMYQSVSFMCRSTCRNKQPCKG